MPNFIPKDYIRLDEAFEVFRQHRRGPDRDKQPSSSDEEIRQWREKYSEEFDTDEHQFKIAFMEGELEAYILSKNGEREFRILPQEWQAANWPTSAFFSEEIFDFHNSPFGKYSGKSAYVSKRVLEEWMRGNVTKQTLANRTKLDGETLKNWFLKRMKNWPDGVASPSEKIDLVKAQQDFPDKIIRRDPFRKIRNDTVPFTWRRQGRRGKGAN